MVATEGAATVAAAGTEFGAPTGAVAVAATLGAVWAVVRVVAGPLLPPSPLGSGTTTSVTSPVFMLVHPAPGPYLPAAGLGGALNACVPMAGDLAVTTSMDSLEAVKLTDELATPMPSVGAEPSCSRASQALADRLYLPSGTAVVSKLMV